jgi:hypothetical protein
VECLRALISGWSDFFSLGGGGVRYFSDREYLCEIPQLNFKLFLAVVDCVPVYLLFYEILESIITLSLLLKKKVIYQFFRISNSKCY